MAMQPYYGMNNANMIMPMDQVMASQNQQYPSSLSNMTPNKAQVYYIPGRSVDSQDEVKPHEVLMDSPVNIFPNNNRKEIYVKYWDEKGIQTDVYTLKEKHSGEASISGDPNVPAYLEDMMTRLERIEKILNANNNRRYYKKKGGFKNGQNNNTSGSSNDKPDR